MASEPRRGSIDRRSRTTPRHLGLAVRRWPRPPGRRGRAASRTTVVHTVRGPKKVPVRESSPDRPGRAHRLRERRDRLSRRAPKGRPRPAEQPLRSRPATVANEARSGAHPTQAKAAVVRSPAKRLELPTLRRPRAASKTKLHRGAGLGVVPRERRRRSTRSRRRTGLRRAGGPLLREVASRRERRSWATIHEIGSRLARRPVRRARRSGRARPHAAVRGWRPNSPPCNGCRDAIAALNDHREWSRPERASET